MTSEFESTEPFSWTEFERLDAFDPDSGDLEQIDIPDNTYRQIKKLNEALVNKANEIAARESMLEQRIQEYQDQKYQFDANRFEMSRPKTESRLEKIICVEKGISFPASELVPGLDKVGQELDGLRELDETSGVGEPANQQVVLDTGAFPIERSQTPADRADVNRLHQSVVRLREKSEVISAVFVELDQMVVDLNRQQELLEKMHFNQDTQPTYEFQKVTDKVKRCFRRISNKISVQSSITCNSQ